VLSVIVGVPTGLASAAGAAAAGGGADYLTGAGAYV